MRLLQVRSGLLAIFGATAFMSGCSIDHPTSEVAVGDPAPDFSATNLATGLKVSLSKEYHGQVTLVNIWATWCGPCRQEIPALQELYKTLGPKGLRIAAVSIDTLPSEKVSAFMKEFGVTFDVLHDRASTIIDAYHSEKFPESFLVDKKGKITRIDYGAKEWTSQELQNLVASLLAEPAS